MLAALIPKSSDRLLLTHTDLESSSGVCSCHTANQVIVSNMLKVGSVNIPPIGALESIIKRREQSFTTAMLMSP
jgi:hypothetical protein